MDMERAIEYLDKNQCTCVLCRGDQLISSESRGVRPLLELLDSGQALCGFCAADKVVGRATAFLYCLLGVRRVHAKVMSKPAAQVLAAHGISSTWDTLVPGIRNRTNTGPCPMEAATADIHDPKEALIAIRETLKRLG